MLAHDVLSEMGRFVRKTGQSVDEMKVELGTLLMRCSSGNGMDLNSNHYVPFHYYHYN